MVTVPLAALLLGAAVAGAATTRASDVPVRVRPLSGRERAMLGSVGVEITHRIYCETIPDGTIPSEQDYWLVDGVTYNIMVSQVWEGAFYAMDCREVR